MSATPAGFSLLQVWALSGAAPASICRPVSHWEVICALWQLSLLGENYRSSVRFSSASLERRFNCFNLRNFQNQFDKTMEAGKRFMDVNLSNLSFIQTPEKKTEKKTASPSSVMDVAPWHQRDAPVAWYDSFLESTFTELHEPIISVELESSFTTEPTFSAFLNDAVTANHTAYVIQVAWHDWRKRKKAERRKQAKERAKMIEKKAEELVQLHERLSSNAYMDSPYQRDPRFVIPSMYHEYHLRRRAHEERINKARSWIAQNLTSNEIERLNIFIKKSGCSSSTKSLALYTAPPKEVVRVDVRHRKTDYLPASPASVPAPASGSLSYGGFYPDQNDDDDDEPSFASRRSTTDFLLTTETVTPDVATSTEEKPEAAPAAEEPQPAPEPHSSTARDSFDAGKPEATTATSSSTFNYSSISNTPYYEERHERALTYGDDRVVLSGQQSYARLGEAHRVSSMFEYPPAHDTYYEEQSEHHEEDESNEQVLLHEYDSGSDYDDAISIGYYSDDH